MTKEMTFNLSRAESADFATDGLRSFFEYRDLGIKDATGGKAQAQVIRARGGHAERAEWHKHVLDFQFFYVLKGWARFEYEGIGEVRVGPGDCVHQPPGIHHREIDHSDDLELIEVTLPGDFETAEVSPADT